MDISINVCTKRTNLRLKTNKYLSYTKSTLKRTKTPSLAEIGNEMSKKLKKIHCYKMGCEIASGKSNFILNLTFPICDHCSYTIYSTNIMHYCYSMLSLGVWSFVRGILKFSLFGYERAYVDSNARWKKPKLCQFIYYL